MLISIPNGQVKTGSAQYIADDADTGLYHIGTRYLDLTPEAAKAFAQNGVAAGF